MPLRPQGKIPLGKLVPRGLHEATTDINIIIKWWTQEPHANVGIRTGKISGLVALDIDPRHEGDDHLTELEAQHGKFPETVEVLTGGGGRHLYFQYPDGETHLKNATNFLGWRGIDIRADGGYVVAPPSLHSSGREYHWEVSSHPDDIPLAPLPHVFHSMLSEKQIAANQALTSPRGPKEVIKEGERNASLTRLAGAMRHRGMSKESIVAALLQENQTRCLPPLSDQEVKQIGTSISRYSPKASYSTDSSQLSSNEKSNWGSSNTQLSRVLQLIEERRIVFFHDQFHTGFAHLPTQNHHATHPLRSRLFRRWLAYQIWQTEKTAPSSDTMERTITILEARAIHEGEQRTLWNRVARLQGDIWYDLGQGAVRIGPGHWEFVPDPPILFYRYSHQQPQVPPTLGGSIADLVPSLHISRDPETMDSTTLLFIVYLVTLIIPDIPHPILAVQGEQGSGKTTLFKVIRDLVDPSAIPILCPQDSLREFIQLASHHWLVWLDNLTKLPEWMSDAMCRCVTGEGFSKRELFSDDEDILYSFRRCQGFNGINLIANKPDLLDRALIFSLERIPDSHRQTEAEFWDHFFLHRPAYLGSLFTILSHAMACLETISPGHYPRMADFARWGEAITVALNLPPERFRNAWAQNQRMQTQETLEASPIAQVLVKLMESDEIWNGSPQQLLERLNALAPEVGVDTKSSLWPKDIRWVWRRMKEIRPSLAAHGIHSFRKREGDQTRIQIVKKLSQNDCDVSVSSNPCPQQEFFRERPE